MLRFLLGCFDFFIFFLTSKKIEYARKAMRMDERDRKIYRERRERERERQSALMLKNLPKLIEENRKGMGNVAGIVGKVRKLGHSKCLTQFDQPFAEGTVKVQHSNFKSYSEISGVGMVLNLRFDAIYDAVLASLVEKLKGVVLFGVMDCMDRKNHLECSVAKNRTSTLIWVPSSKDISASEPYSGLKESYALVEAFVEMKMLHRKRTLRGKLSSCHQIQRHNPGCSSGIYTIFPTAQLKMSVWCDMETDGGGWTVIDPHRSAEWLQLLDGYQKPKLTRLAQFFGKAHQSIWMPTKEKSPNGQISHNSWKYWFLPSRESPDGAFYFRQSPECMDVRSTFRPGEAYAVTGNFYGCKWYNGKCNTPMDQNMTIECSCCHGYRQENNFGQCTHMPADANVGYNYKCGFDWWNHAPSLGANGKYCVAFREPFDRSPTTNSFKHHDHNKFTTTSTTHYTLTERLAPVTSFAPSTSPLIVPEYVEDYLEITKPSPAFSVDERGKVLVVPYGVGLKVMFRKGNSWKLDGKVNGIRIFIFFIFFY
jgi:hypothetical protein